MRDESAIALHQAEGVFQFRSAGKDRAARTKRHRERLRRVAARPANGILASAMHADHGIVGADMNRAVVDQKTICDVVQAPGGVAIDICNRFVGNISARENERPQKFRAEQMMDRRVREHQADIAISRSNRRRQPGLGNAAQEHDRTPRTGQRLLFSMIDFG